MTENLWIGCGTMAVCLVVQGLVVGILLRNLARLEASSLIRPTMLWSVALLLGAMLAMLVGNLVQVAIWAGLFLACGEFNDFTTAFYHSVVNFSTLGYGDVVMSEQRRLLGGLEAANGVLMFGLTTSVLYAVLHALMRRAWDQRTGPSRQTIPSIES
jgi:hypothetical protein